ncbi:STAS/SEC14 domain-containing protein [Salipaludibacillus aurantiacus]|uniref:SpoIIAA-like n=1 Tax=Salipaludibacillus aurantiacus TaxID=1601833 RepID=A0A1H9UZN4_9BACI|nr:STAS/SEC14 domain-containing protein [Salipaludibacillus aurantiacus]SES14876.1 SpoIIAA-like [Salipaludibacillus aurantiacus]
MIRKLETSRENILEYEVIDKLTEEENEQVLDEVRQCIRKYGKVRFLVRLKDMPHTELSAIDDRLKFAKEHMSQIEKYALVTDYDAAEYIGKFADKLTSINVRQFAKDEEEMARSWVRED